MGQNNLSLATKIKMYEAREAIFTRISREICSVIDLDLFLQATVNELGKMLGVDRCDIMVAPHGFAPKINFEYRPDKSIPSSLNLSFPFGDGPFREYLGKIKSPIVINDTSAPTLPEMIRKMSYELKTLSALVVPIIFQGELLGMIGLHHCLKTHSWQQEEVNFVNSLAQQIAIAFQYTKLYMEKKKEVEITKLLLELANDMNSKIDFDEITSFILEKSAGLFKADLACVGIIDSAKEQINFGSFSQSLIEKRHLLKKERLHFSDKDSLLNPLIFVEKKAFSMRADEEGPLSSLYFKEAFSGEMGLIAPLHIGGDLIGTINLVWEKKRMPFRVHELNLLEGIANQAAIALERDRLSAEVTRLQKELKGVRASEIIIGTSDNIKSCMAMALNVADATTTVLLQGESGTGKELFADLIQRNSPRADRPYIKINCGAIPENLIEVELFGHEKGAFTDAKTRRIGKFEEANGGTLFLDEIGELSANAQVKLLRVLQDGEMCRVGSNETIKVNVRVLAASNLDLHEAVKEVKFRKDLFYRLNVYPITPPPLRERKEDIILLANHFLNIYNKRSNKSIVGISDKAMHLLRAYDWPGNVRELQNVIERAIIMATKRVITVDDIEGIIEVSDSAFKEKHIDIELSSPMEEVERKMILETLNYVAGNKKKAAELLGIGRKTLYRKLGKYGYAAEVGELRRSASAQALPGR